MGKKDYSHLKKSAYLYAPNSTSDFESLPTYLLNLLEESLKEKPDTKYWRKETYDFSTGKYDVSKPLNKGIFSELWHPDTYRTGIYKTAGWIFNFSKSWKNYLVNWKNYGWIEQKAPNKTFIRDHATHKKDIIKIVELTK